MVSPKLAQEQERKKEWNVKACVACIEILIIEAEGASDMQRDLIRFMKAYIRVT